jgi:hypothetical protein
VGLAESPRVRAMPMRWVEYLFFVLVSIGASFLATAIVRDYWSSKVKAVFRFVVPALVFIVLSFVFVLTGERIEDMVAKELFCWAYSFEACKNPRFVESPLAIPGAPNEVTGENLAKPQTPDRSVDSKSDQPSVPLTESASSADKIFLNVTPDYLIDLFKDRTVSEGHRLTGVYLGKWMRLSGSLDTIEGPDEYGDISIHFSTPEHNIISMVFSKDWVSQFAVLRPGQKISVVCRVKDVSPVFLRLEKCELALD